MTIKAKLPNTLQDVAQGLSTTNLQVELKPSDEPIFHKGEIGLDHNGFRVVRIYFPAKNISRISRRYLEEGVRAVLATIPVDDKGGDNL